jgi:phosphoribosylformylglycinamidine synthase I
VGVNIGVVTFPGSLDDRDAVRAVARAGATPIRLWHADEYLHGVDAVVLPGGFSYGDYLRCGAIARFAAVMETIADAARGGLPVLGICNGFQILCEAHLLPGALTRNEHLHFRNRDQRLRILSTGSAWTGAFESGQEIVIPVKNGEGRYVANTRTLDELEADNRIVARYVGGNPNGSLRDIAAIRNEAGNVVGIMPHPEHAVEELTGPSLDGLGFFASLLQYLSGASPAADSTAGEAREASFPAGAGVGAQAGAAR